MGATGVTCDRCGTILRPSAGGQHVGHSHFVWGNFQDARRTTGESQHMRGVGEDSRRTGWFPPSGVVGAIFLFYYPWEQKVHFDLLSIVYTSDPFIKYIKIGPNDVANSHLTSH
jgi:hypothetical protein